MPYSGYPILGQETFLAPSMRQSAQTNIPPNHQKALRFTRSKLNW